MKMTIEVSPEGVARRWKNHEESVRWSQLTAVEIFCTDEGPFVEDVFFVLAGADGGGCVIPHGAAVEIGLLETLHGLAEFDDLAVIDAMGCTDNARFTCWQGPAGQGVAAAPEQTKRVSMGD